MDILDDIEFNKYSSRCVSLTAAEYKMMYYVQYGDTTKFTRRNGRLDHLWLL